MTHQKIISQTEFNIILDSLNFSFKEIDVREMEMPLPMITIVNELESISEINALLVNHHRIPQILLNDLEDRNLKIFITQIQENYFQLLFLNS
ncbi:MAG: hypothetical protein Q8S44_02860 [Flavobacteriaceae bacterium]|nr:hypothetical protein [Flavobacteriaceae bacterium]